MLKLTVIYFVIIAIDTVIPANHPIGITARIFTIARNAGINLTHGKRIIVPLAKIRGIVNCAGIIILSMPIPSGKSRISILVRIAGGSMS